MSLAEEIQQYYLNNYHLLSFNSKFHLASRLVAWQGNESAKKILRQLKKDVVTNDLTSTIDNLVNLPVRKVYGQSIRLNYFDKYPRLFGIHEALFRVRHLKEIYGIDAKKDLLEAASRNELDALYFRLINDDEAIRILARFAIDFISLYEYLFEVPSQFERERILEQKTYYNLNDPIQLHLLIYLYTHAIITDTNFYIQEVPSNRLLIYQELLKELDAIIQKHSSVKFDTKFEYLVASRICHKVSPLHNEIDHQAQESINKSGKFIIDRTLGEDSKLNTFNGSEHRNVLYIMSSSAYEPKAQRV